MAVNVVSVQYNNGGLLADIILLTRCYYLPPSGNPFKYHEEVLSLQSIITLNGAPRVWAEKYIFCAQNTDETATRL